MLSTTSPVAILMALVGLAEGAHASFLAPKGAHGPAVKGTHSLTMLTYNVSWEAAGTSKTKYMPKESVFAYTKAKEVGFKYNPARANIWNTILKHLNGSYQASKKGFGVDIVALQENDLLREVQQDVLDQGLPYGFAPHGAWQRNSHMATLWNTKRLRLLKFAEGEFTSGRARPFQVFLFEDRKMNVKTLVVNAHAPHKNEKGKHYNNSDLSLDTNTLTGLTWYICTQRDCTDSGKNRTATKAPLRKELQYVSAIVMLGDFNRAVNSRDIQVAGHPLFQQSFTPGTMVGFGQTGTKMALSRNHLEKGKKSDHHGHGPDQVLLWVNKDHNNVETDGRNNKIVVADKKWTTHVASDHLPVRAEFTLVQK